MSVVKCLIFFAYYLSTQKIPVELHIYNGLLLLVATFVIKTLLLKPCKSIIGQFEYLIWLQLSFQALSIG